MNRLSLYAVAALIGLLWAFRMPAPQNATLTAATKPNILFVIADDAGLDFSAYGSRWVNTPNFDRLAREGVLFARAYTPNAKCAPSRAALLTGRNPWQLEAAMNHNIAFPPHYKSFMEALADGGYTTGHTAKGYAPGRVLTADGKPRPITGPGFNTAKTTPPAKGIGANDYAGNVAEFLRQAPSGKPWAFWVGMTEPHRGYEYGSGIAKGGKRPEQIDRVPGYWPDSLTVRTDMLDYAFEIEYVDRQLGQILKLLTETGQLANTLIVFTSDHGMPFPRVKGNQYEAANHIPLAIYWPAGIKKPGRTLTDYVSFVDMAPTLLQAAGLSWAESGMKPAIGRSLLPLLQSAKNGAIDPARSAVLVGQERHDVGRPNDQGYPVRGIYTDNWLYLHNYATDRWPACNPETGYLNCDGGATKTFLLNLRRRGLDKRYWTINFGKRPANELYDLRRDPDCLNNLATNATHQTRMTRMRSQMEKSLTAQGDWRMQNEGERYEQYPVVENRNFYERYMKGEKLPTPWVNDDDFEKGAVE